MYSYSVIYRFQKPDLDIITNKSTTCDERNKYA
jgi:hypothetical protein